MSFPVKSLDGPVGRRPPRRNLQTELTDRELQVLELISRGMSNSRIGAQTFLAMGTVKSHVKALFYKLDARDRAHAVRIGFERGLLQPGAAPVRHPNPITPEVATAAYLEAAAANFRIRRPLTTADIVAAFSVAGIEVQS